MPRHTLPVWGVWNDDDLRFMFSCAPTARRAPPNIRGNPGSCSPSTARWSACSVEGTAAPITDPSRIDTWIDRYVAKYSNEIPEGLGDFVRQHTMFEVVPTTAFAVIKHEDEFALRATRWRFT